MAKLTRKLWVGIGAATIASTSLTGAAAAQDHKGHAPAQATDANKGTATGTAAEGGEAYLTDGGPRDTRIRFYRDLELMRGHLLVGHQLIELGLWDEALPHFLHPTEELYGLMEKYIKLHNIPPFRRELLALSQTVKAKRKGAYVQALKAVDRHLDGAFAVARRFMTPLPTFTVRTVAEVLKTALSEYESSIESDHFVKPVEYQDSRGFVWQAERMIEGAAAELQKVNPEALAQIRATLAKLKAAWPAPMPPPAPVLQVSQMSALISDIEQLTSKY